MYCVQQSSSLKHLPPQIFYYECYLYIIILDNIFDSQSLFVFRCDSSLILD